MAIADIFEALTAVDRPYKKGKTLSEAVGIMASMVREQHIDPDLFELFLRAGVYRQYGERFLQAGQVDEVDVESVLGPRRPEGAGRPAFRNFPTGAGEDSDSRGRGEGLS
jgi:hypothetical protein